MSLGKYSPKVIEAMRAYLIVARNTWDEIFTYRLNFVMWRVRVVLQFLTIYILWVGLSSNQQVLFGYSKSLILTYILGTSFLSAIVLSSRTQEIGENINSGDLSTFLIKPFDYFKYWFARDLGDKAMNIFFAIFEFAILFLLLKPPLFVQTDPIYLALTLLAIILATLLYFFFGSLLGMIGFWSPEIWAPRFLSYILVFFFAGGLFPLDIFPKAVYEVIRLLPFSYLLYFPLKIYLGQLSINEIIFGLLTSLTWILVFFLTVQFIWKKGLKRFGAEGR